MLSSGGSEVSLGRNIGVNQCTVGIAIHHVTFWTEPVFHTASAFGVMILGDQTDRAALGLMAAPWTINMQEMTVKVTVKNDLSCMAKVWGARGLWDE